MKHFIIASDKPNTPAFQTDNVIDVIYILELLRHQDSFIAVVDTQKVITYDCFNKEDYEALIQVLSEEYNDTWLMDEKEYWDEYRDAYEADRGKDEEFYYYA